jgi:hypothetical protein
MHNGQLSDFDRDARSHWHHKMLIESYGVVVFS